jgi:predicted PurR-regulated permease PerM
MEDQDINTEETEYIETESDELDSSLEETPKEKEGGKGGKLAIALITLLFVIIIAGSIVLAFQSPQSVGAVRDIFIILMALMLVVIGTAMVILILQVSNLINILKNDIKPMLESGSDTINTLKGTVRFLSDNLTEPVIKLNESLASLKRIGQIFKIIRD